MHLKKKFLLGRLATVVVATASSELLLLLFFLGGAASMEIRMKTQMIVAQINKVFILSNASELNESL